MESNRCKKHRGEGAILAAQPPQPDGSAPCQALQIGDFASTSADPCRHVDRRGHRCQMLSLDASGLCAHHSRRARRDEIAAQEAASAELLAGIKDFSSAAAVNLFLGNLVKQVVRNRIPRRDAVALAYLSQLILNSLSAMNHERQRNEKPRVPTIIFDDIFSPSFGTNPPAEKRTETTSP